MKHCCLGIVASLLLTVSAWADLTIHLQSPFRNDATASEYIPHVVGGVTDEGGTVVETGGVSLLTHMHPTAAPGSPSTRI